MCVEGEIFFKINKRDSTFIREMRVVLEKSTDLELTEGQRVMYYRTILGLSTTTHSVFINKP